MNVISRKIHKSITVSEEAYKIAKQLKQLGLAESISDAFAKAMKEYMSKYAYSNHIVDKEVPEVSVSQLNLGGRKKK